MAYAQEMLWNTGNLWHLPVSTVDSKIIRALEISRVKKLISNAVLRNKYLSSHELWALYCL